MFNNGKVYGIKFVDSLRIDYNIYVPEVVVGERVNSLSDIGSPVDGRFYFCDRNWYSFSFFNGGFNPITGITTMWDTQVGLIQGRHPIPVDQYIFKDSIEDVTDVEGLEETAEEFLSTMTGGFKIPLHINLAVTGLTVALIAVLNICHKHEDVIHVTLWHYNNVTEEYYSQEVI